MLPGCYLMISQKCSRAMQSARNTRPVVVLITCELSLSSMVRRFPLFKILQKRRLQYYSLLVLARGETYYARY